MSLFQRKSILAGSMPKLDTGTRYYSQWSNRESSLRDRCEACGSPDDSDKSNAPDQKRAGISA
jgi:hypothetical protein